MQMPIRNSEQSYYVKMHAFVFKRSTNQVRAVEWVEDYICVVGRIRTRFASFTHTDLEMELRIKKKIEFYLCLPLVCDDNTIVL